jgi:hypothetical protein
MKYMRDNHLCYRGVPCKLDEKGIDPSALGKDIYPSLLRVRNSMMQAGLLNRLKHVDSTNYKWDVVIIVSKTRPGSSV